MEFNTEGKKAEEALDVINKAIEESTIQYNFKLEKVIVTKMIHVLYRYISNNMMKSPDTVSSLLRALEKYEGDLKRKDSLNWSTAVPLDLNEKFAKFNETEGYSFAVKYPDPQYSSEETIGKFIFKAVVNMNDLKVDLGHTVETPPVYTPAQKYWRSVIED